MAKRRARPKRTDARPRRRSQQRSPARRTLSPAAFQSALVLWGELIEDFARYARQVNGVLLEVSAGRSDNTLATRRLFEIGREYLDKVATLPARVTPDTDVAARRVSRGSPRRHGRPID